MFRLGTGSEVSWYGLGPGKGLGKHITFMKVCCILCAFRASVSSAVLFTAKLMDGVYEMLIR